EEEILVTNRVRFAALLSAAAILVAACGSAATPAPTAAPTPVPSVGATAAPATPTPAPTVDPNSLLGKILAAGKIRIATDPNYKPFSYLDDNQQYDGFDVKTAEEVAKRLGAMYGKDLQVEWVTPSWDAITAGNWGGRWDISIGSMSVTAGRAKVVDFADPYYYDFGGIGIPADSTVTTLDELAGKKICVGSSTTYEQWLSGTLEIVDPNMLKPPANADVTPLETDNLCVQALKSGRKFDAIAANANGIGDWIKSGLPVKMLEIGPIFTVSVSFALDKSGPSTADIMAPLNQIVADLHSDGTLSGLSTKYLSRDVTIKP
ncbi:MAG: transporter substrate-binding domain-containing protein, partial [Chloroflexota bacterium]